MVQVAFGDHRTDDRRGIVCRADTQGAAELDHLRDEFVEEGALDEQARRCDAHLTRMEGPGARTVLHRVRDVAIAEYDARGLAAELEQQSLHRLATDLGDSTANVRAPREGDHVDIARHDEGLAEFRSASAHVVDDAGRQTRRELSRQLGHAEGILNRRLHDDGVAHGECGPDLPGAVGDWRIGGADARDDADRLSRRDAGGELRAAARDRLAFERGHRDLVALPGELRVHPQPVDRHADL